jgi:hypothetical protein
MKLEGGRTKRGSIRGWEIEKYSRGGKYSLKLKNSK